MPRALMASSTLGWSFDGTGKQGFQIGAWVKNLTNRQYLAYALNQKDADTGLLGFDYALVGEPRTFDVDTTYRLRRI